MRTRTSAFTLIELLIVVAIIAILAAIAVPNFLEAQTRSKVSRVKADQRSLATALEAYYVDQNNYAPNVSDFAIGLVRLSTPVAYITDAWVEDPFGNSEWATYNGRDSIYFYYNYHQLASEPLGALALQVYPWWDGANAARFHLSSAGPTRVFKYQICDENGEGNCAVKFTAEMLAGNDRYDPTNGTISKGLIQRTHKGVNEGKILAITPVTGPFYGY